MAAMELRPTRNGLAEMPAIEARDAVRRNCRRLWLNLHITVLSESVLQTALVLRVEGRRSYGEINGYLDAGAERGVDGVLVARGNGDGVDGSENLAAQGAIHFAAHKEQIQ